MLIAEQAVALLVTFVRTPLLFPFEVSSDGQEGLIIGEETVVIESCEGWRPVIGSQLS